MAVDTAEELLPDAPRSAKAVLCALADRGPLTMADLQRECHLARRTVYGAVHALLDRGLLAQQQSLRDARQTFFWVPRRLAGHA